MEKRSLIKYFTAAALMLLLASFNPVYAAPMAQDANLLDNPSFEQPFVNGTAEGWSSWALQTEKTGDECLDGYHYLPKWNMESSGNFVADGVTSQYIGNNWDTWSAGVMQTVEVTPGATYRFTFNAKGRTTSEASPAPSDFGVNMNIRAGIDPNGSGLWNDADVVWSASGSPHDSWQTFSIEATATGDKMTVLTAADLGVPGINQCRQYLDTWYDGAQLVAVGAAPAEAAPAAQAATEAPATAIPSPTPETVASTEPLTEQDQEPDANQSGEPTAETPAEEAPAEEAPAGEAPATGGTICVNAFHDENANGLLDDSEGHMAGITIMVANETTVVGQAISDGSNVATCFHSLAPGPYQVAQQVPGRLEMTTAGNALVAVTDNHTVQVSFGSRLRQDETPSAGATQAPADAGESENEPAPEASQSSGASPLALSGLAVILVGVLLLGLLLFFVLRR
jgi:hypothetical protein